ncbi:hypothetical protein Q9L58_002287 [Maublancomyces gigas]|uniref:F-box domain-containing protein n=1 Tax=Discina gigas TaxID=1032678 RepID=A0ABR3GRZ9_9PEZI
MLPLQSFPNEILLDIFSRLQHRDLARTSRVSREISQPLLYKDPFLLKSSPPTPLGMFLQSLLTPGREALATYVRDLTVEWDNVSQTGSDITRYRGAQSTGTQLMTLLHMLPELHGLHLLPPYQCDQFDRLFGSFHARQSIATLPLAFQSLREFRCHWDSHDRGVSTEAIVLLLRLPYIRRINIPFATETEPCSPTVNAAIAAAAGTSTITHLEFALVLSRPSSLAAILKIPRALMHFSYFGGRQNLDAFDLAAFGRTLQPLRRSLKSLHLDFTNLYSNDRDNNKLTATIGSLHQWPVLNIIQCPLLALLGQGPQSDSPLQLADVLPVGIRELEILSDRYWSLADTVHEVVVLLGQKEMVPRLKRVAVYKDYRGDYQLPEKLRAACRAAEVELVELH